MSIASVRPAPRRLAPGLMAAATAALLSACGASLDAQTYQERNNAESTNAATGALALRNIYVEALPSGKLYEVGTDATVSLTVTNAGTEPDRLVAVTSSAAQEVVVVAGDDTRTLVVPPLGSTGSTLELELRGLTRPLRAGEFVDLEFRFAKNGSTKVLAPVATTGVADRPVYTGERFEGGHEPALQAPAGGHHGKKAEGAAEAGHESEPTATGEAEPGTETHSDDTSPSPTPS